VSCVDGEIRFSSFLVIWHWHIAHIYLLMHWIWFCFIDGIYSHVLNAEDPVGSIVILERL
jgi:hypothetical protein